MRAALKHLLLAVILAGIFPAATAGQSAVQRTLAWDPPVDTTRVTEYRVERNFVFLGSTTQSTFSISILPGETVTLRVRSFGWCQDIMTGGFFACEGPLSEPLTYTEPVVQSPAPPPLSGPGSSADGATCQISRGCSLVDVGLNVWSLGVSGAILRNGQHWNGGYSDWLLWFAGKMYAYRSDANAWWVDTASGWAWVAYDPRSVPSANGAACQVGTGCALIDAGLNVWSLGVSGAILRNGQHWNSGYSDWLIWFAGGIYAYRSDANAWWVDTASGWTSAASDPRGQPSADGSGCSVGTRCSLVDAGLNVWTLDASGAILRNGQHRNGGYSDWLLWFAGKIYAHRSDVNAWWVDTESGWALVW